MSDNPLIDALSGSGNRMNPGLLFENSDGDADDIAKSNLNDSECMVMSASDALSDWRRDPMRISVISRWKHYIRRYSRARGGKSINAFTDIMKDRVTIQDRKDIRQVNANDGGLGGLTGMVK